MRFWTLCPPVMPPPDPMAQGFPRRIVGRNDLRPKPPIIPAPRGADSKRKPRYADRPVKPLTAFDELFNFARAYAAKLLRRLDVSPADREEIAAEAIVRVWQRLRSAKALSKRAVAFATIRAVGNATRDYLAQQTAANEARREMLERGEELTAARECATGEDHAAWQAALDSIPPKLRDYAVFFAASLRRAPYSNREVARYLGVSEFTVRSRRRELLEHLALR